MLIVHALLSPTFSFARKMCVYVSIEFLLSFSFHHEPHFNVDLLRLLWHLNPHLVAWKQHFVNIWLSIVNKRHANTQTRQSNQQINIRYQFCDDAESVRMVFFSLFYSCLGNHRRNVSFIFLKRWLLRAQYANLMCMNDTVEWHRIKIQLWLFFSTNELKSRWMSKRFLVIWRKKAQFLFFLRPLVEEEINVEFLFYVIPHTFGMPSRKLSSFTLF